MAWPPGRREAAEVGRRHPSPGERGALGGPLPQAQGRPQRWEGSRGAADPPGLGSGTCAGPSERPAGTHGPPPRLAAFSAAPGLMPRICILSRSPQCRPSHKSFSGGALGKRTPSFHRAPRPQAWLLRPSPPSPPRGMRGCQLRPQGPSSSRGRGGQLRNQNDPHSWRGTKRKQEQFHSAISGTE